MATHEIDLKIPGVVWVGRDLYCKTPADLEAAHAKLREIGYEIQDNRTDGYSVTSGQVTPEQMEKQGHSLWYARLPELGKVKCGGCQRYSDTKGCRVHERPCKHCDAVLFRYITDGTRVTFSFVNEAAGAFGPKLCMEARSWDAKAGYVYLKPEFFDERYDAVVGDEALAYLDRHQGKWELLDEDTNSGGTKLYKIRYQRRPFVNDDYEPVIEMHEVRGHEYNYKVVLLWEGKEYSELSPKLPVPESFSIYEAWHWAPLTPSPMLHRRLLWAIHNADNKDWHHQDGSPWFTRWHWDEIAKFIEHFTTLDADEWRRQSRRFPADGPGGIDAVAAFCHPQAKARNESNIGNAPTAAGKVMDALEFDPRTGEFLGATSDPANYYPGLKHGRRFPRP